MTEELEAAPEMEAAEEVVTEEVTEEGQIDDQPAGDAGEEAPEEPEKVSASKQRRERRKAEVARLQSEKAQAEAELAETNERLARIQEAAANTAPPKESDFAEYADFEAARNAYFAGKEMDKRETRRIEEEAEKRQSRVQQIETQTLEEAKQNWSAQAEEARTRYADFDVVTSAQDLAITQSMASLLTTSDSGADVAYYLGTNKAEAALIARMSPLEQAMAIGRLEARVSLPKPKIQSNAPDPVNPVRPKATATKDPAKMTNAEYRKWRGYS